MSMRFSLILGSRRSRRRAAVVQQFAGRAVMSGHLAWVVMAATKCPVNET